jgi:hypothetical protein
MDIVNFLVPGVVDIVRVNAQSNCDIQLNLSIKEILEGALMGHKTVPSSDNKENIAVLRESLVKQKFKAIFRYPALGQGRLEL